MDSVDCDVAREALSARIDGEPEPVPVRRVDEHLDECEDCRWWYARARGVTEHLRTVAGHDKPVMAAVGDVARGPTRGSRRPMYSRWALAVVGVAQVALGGLQAAGVSVGIHAGMHSAHLLNESTAWSMALGVVMILAAARPEAAAGLGAVMVAFTVVLTGYVLSDALSGAVTSLRVLSHLPVLLGTVLTLLVWRDHRDPRPGRTARAPRDHDDDIELPPHASRGRRRGHLWPTDGSAA